MYDLVAPPVGLDTSSEAAFDESSDVGDDGAYGVPLGRHWLLFIANGTSLTCSPN
jgi:hypothetical protein